MSCPEIEFSASKIKLHSRQAVLACSPSRFTVGTCGRRFGKTLGLLVKLARAACKYHARSNVLYWWCAPTYTRAVKAFEEFERAMRSVIARAARDDYSIVLLNGVRIEFVSLKEWANRKGDGLDGVVFDEAARCPSAAWTELVYPALMDKRGWAVLISTPLGRNWFYREYMKGIATSPTFDKTYASYRFPSSDNPFLHPDEIETLKKNLPEDTFRQEVLAEFLVEGAGVFLGLSNLIPTHEELIRGHGILNPAIKPIRSYMGVDLAKHQDFSIIHEVGVYDGVRPQTIAWERSTHIDWKVQGKLVVAHAKRNNARVSIDSSGAGDYIYEELRDAGVDVFPVKFSSPVNRQQLYNNLKVAISRGVFSMPKTDDTKVFWDEHESFEYQLTDGGKLTVGPPEGEHDDSVAAAALVTHAMLRDSKNGDFSEFEPKNQIKIIRSLESIPKEVLNMMAADVNAGPFNVGFASPFSGGQVFGGYDGDHDGYS